MTDQQKKAVEEAADKMNIRPLSRLAFMVGAGSVLNNPEKYKLIDSQSYYTAIRASADLKEENTRLREALYVTHASLCTYGKHPLIDEQVSKALKGGESCKP